MNTKNKTTLKVDGMTCHSCVTHVTRALCEIEGVTGADVDLRLKQATVEHDADGPSVATLLAALREAGYDGSVTQPVVSAPEARV